MLDAWTRLHGEGDVEGEAVIGGGEVEGPDKHGAGLLELVGVIVRARQVQQQLRMAPPERLAQHRRVHLAPTNTSAARGMPQTQGIADSLGGRWGPRTWDTPCKCKEQQRTPSILK